MSQDPSASISEPDAPAAGTGAARAAFEGIPAGNGHAPTLEAVRLLTPAESPGLQRRDSLRRWALAGADVVSLCTAYVAVWLLTSPPQSLVAKAVLLAALPFWIVLNKLLGLYDRDANVVNKSTLDELPRICQSVVLGSALVFLASPAFPGLEAGRTQALAFMAVATVVLPTARAVTRRVLNGRGDPERCLIVGSGEVAASLARKLVSHPRYGVNLVGFIDDAVQRGEDGRALAPNGGLADFEEVCSKLGVERVVIAFSAISDSDLLGVLQTSKRLGLKVSVVPRMFEAIGGAVEVDHVDGMSLLGLRALGRTRSSLALKRAIDLIGASVGLIVFAPLLLAIAVAVKLNSRGPALFRQERIGRGNRPFRMYKFRTMHDGAHELRDSLLHLNEAAHPMFKIADDPRLTPVGRVLRRFSVDELPQLWNVLRGEMSLVGPRPLVPDEDNHIIGPHRARLDLTPGLTGPWQVMSRQTQISFAEMIKLDYLYVADWSLWNDVKLLLRTALVINGRGH